VMDLVDAHVAALAYLERGGPSGPFNIGTGVGESVAEVIAVASEVTGSEVPVTFGPRRPGDPPSLVANPRRAEERLGFRARRSAIERVLADAWQLRLIERCARGADRPWKEGDRNAR